jgi:hypothetical protein
MIWGDASIDTKIEYNNTSHLINLITWYLWWRQNADFW